MLAEKAVMNCWADAIVREEATELLSGNIFSDLGNFEELLQIERKVREETQSKIFSMIDEVHNKLQNDISVLLTRLTERVDRKERARDDH